MNRNGNLSQCPHFIEYKTFVVKDFGFFVNLNGVFLTKKPTGLRYFFCSPSAYIYRSIMQKITFRQEPTVRFTRSLQPKRRCFKGS